MVSVIQQVVGALHNFKSTLSEQIANRRRIMDGLPDVFLETQFPVFKHPDLQIHLALSWLGHLEPHPNGIAEIHLKRFTGRHLMLIENVKDKITAVA